MRPVSDISENNGIRKLLKNMDKESEVQVKDIAEIVAETMNQET